MNKPMSDMLIPTEVLNFFSDGVGKTLLVKGNPGAGKTIFAFTLLRELKKKGVYLSTRVDTESLYNHIGWLKENLPAENIIDATQSERQKSAGSSMIKALKYTNVPDFLKGVYERTESLERALVIIDSWDAVVSHTGFHEPREREKLEHNLCDFSRKTGTDIIFIAEYVEQKPLDYLVDGVVVATNIIREDMRRVRTLELQKLRGGPMKQPIYLYSLSGGVFRGFPVFKGYPKHNNLKLPPPLPDINPERLSTGIKDLDAIIAGYGSFNLCRGDRTAYDLVRLFFMLNSLSLGKRLCLTVSEQSLLKKAGAFIPKKILEKQVLPVEKAGDLTGHIAVLKEQDAISGTIFFLCLDDLEKHGNVEKLISEITQRGGFVLGFISEGTIIDAELESMAATSIVSQMNFGVPCIYSNVPVTGLNVMSLDDTDGFLSLSLNPVL